MWDKLRVQLLVIFVLAVVVRLGLIVAWHTNDFKYFDSGDYTLYRIGAQDIRANGDFSNSLFLVRPPLFSLVILGLNVNNDAVLLFNAVIGGLIACTSVILCRQVGISSAFAGIAGAIVALDPSSIIYSAFLGPEALANFFLVLTIILLLAGVKTASTGRSWLAFSAAAFSLILSSYARPATYMLWIFVTLWLVVMYRNRWWRLVIFAALCAAGISLWIFHNGAVFGNRTFSTVAPYTMLYYRAASIERIATGQDINAVYTDINRRVETRLGGDVSQVDAEWRQRYLAASPQVADALQSVALDIFKAHPLVYIETVPVGFARMYGLLPESSDLLPFSDNLLSRAGQIIWNGLFLLGTAAGIWLAFRQKNWLLLSTVLLIIVYYTGGTLLVKSAGMNTRERSMLEPFMALSCVYGLEVMRARWFSKTRQPEPA